MKKLMIKFLFGSRKQLVDAIAKGAKLTKADAGRAADATIDLIHKSLSKERLIPLNQKLKTVFGGKGQITM